MEAVLTKPNPVIQEKKKSISPAVQRVTSIDIVRALTMVLMIFVNNLGSLKDIPEWLEHKKRGVDGIGLADVVFPAFCFIVGLSLLYAIDTRRKKGDTDWQLVQHVLVRTVALLVMGLFLVNGETYNAAATGMPRPFWNPIVCFCFILLWNIFPEKVDRKVVITARVVGIVTLLTLAIIYRGGPDDNIQRFTTQWWGILGSIGWAYLAGGLITIFARNRFYPILAGWAFFCILSMVNKAGLIHHEGILYFIPNTIFAGTLVGLTMGGVLTAYIFRYYHERQDNTRLTVTLLGFAALMIALSIIVRPYWGLAKLGATPAWLFLCSAFTTLAFLTIYWVADVKGKASWFDFIKPAGTATLLCYLIPYFANGVVRLFGIQLPDELITGGVGLLKSFLYALMCVWITGGLLKLGFKLKI